MHARMANPHHQKIPMCFWTHPEPESDEFLNGTTIQAIAVTVRRVELGLHTGMTTGHNYGLHFATHCEYVGSVCQISKQFVL